MKPRLLFSGLATVVVSLFIVALAEKGYGENSFSDELAKRVQSDPTLQKGNPANKSIEQDRSMEKWLLAIGIIAACGGGFLLTVKLMKSSKNGKGR
jgi:hypothetical protein